MNEKGWVPEQSKNERRSENQTTAGREEEDDRRQSGGRRPQAERRTKMVRDIDGKQRVR